MAELVIGNKYSFDTLQPSAIYGEIFSHCQVTSIINDLDTAKQLSTRDLQTIHANVYNTVTPNLNTDLSSYEFYQIKDLNTGNKYIVCDKWIVAASVIHITSDVNVTLTFNAMNPSNVSIIKDKLAEVGFKNNIHYTLTTT